MNRNYDVLILGGGPAGLGAAMALGRLRRTAVVCDDFRPRNLAAEHMHNFPGAEGLPPLEWRKKARRDVEGYGTIDFFDGAVNSLDRTGSGFEAALSSGQSTTVRKVILAHGVQDQLPSLPGLEELWGKSAFHCPFCHGYEQRDKRLGLLADSPYAMQLLPMSFALSSDLILFTHGKTPLSAGQREALQRREIRVVEEPVESLLHDGPLLKGILAGGKVIERDAILVRGRIPFQMKSPIGEVLGLEKTETGLYKVSEGNRTSVPGVYAGGDIMTMQHTVLGAVATGQAAGIAAVHDLLNESFAA
jgi:thioredoxin reductase